MKYSIALALIALMLYFSSVTAIEYKVAQTEWYNSTNCAAGTKMQPIGYTPYSGPSCSTSCQSMGSASATGSCYESIANVTLANAVFVFSYSDSTCSEGNFRGGYSIPIDTCISGPMISLYVKDATSIKTSGCDTLYYYSDAACTVLKSQVKISSTCASSTTMTCKIVANNAFSLTMNSMLLISLLIVAFLF